MPTEFRRITFNPNDVRRAINHYKGNGKTPKGEILMIRSKRHKGRNGYEIEALEQGNGKPQQYFINEDNALEMLIQSCIQSQIALPKVARKLVREIDSRLCLDLITE